MVRVQHLLPPRAVIGMNRRLQILEGKRLARPSSEKTGAGLREIEFELRQTQFERAEMSGVQRRLQQALAFGEIGQCGAGLILAAAAPDRGADDADQRGRMKRPLDEGDVAERMPEPGRVGITLGTAALMGQQHEWKIRPWRLTVEPGRERAQIRRLDRLVGNHGETGAAFDFSAARRRDRRRRWHDTPLP